MTNEQDTREKLVEDTERSYQVTFMGKIADDGFLFRNEQDTREKLVEDIADMIGAEPLYEIALKWLDRQEAITRRECGDAAWKANYRHVMARADKLQEQVDELTEERDEAVRAYDAHIEAHDVWHEPEDITYTRNRFAFYEQATKERIARLESERDELKKQVDDLTRYREKVHPDCDCCGWTDKVAELTAERDDYKASMETLEANANLWREQADKLKAENKNLHDRVNGLLLELLIIAGKLGAENADNAES